METQMITTEPAETYTLEDFISLSGNDDLTYYKFIIKNYLDGATYTGHNLLDYYLPELKKLCLKIKDFTYDERMKYKYRPDLLSYDVYKTVGLDWLILICNGIIDPKEFDLSVLKVLRLPNVHVLKEFMSEVYASESDWISIGNVEYNQQKADYENEIYYKYKKQKRLEETLRRFA